MDRELAHLIAVAEKGSVTQAAFALGLTQSALTKSLQRLEGRLGLSLFERSARGVRLTREGTAILARAKSVEAEYRYLDLEAAEFRTQAQRQIRIGASPSWAVSVLPGVVAALRTTYPALRIDTSIDLEAQVVDALTEGRIDFALAGDLGAVPAHGADFDPMGTLDTLVACRTSHPLFGRAADDATLLAANWLDYRGALDRPRGDAPPLRHRITGVVSTTSAWSMVPLLLAQTDQLATLPEQMVEHLARFDVGFLSQEVRVSSIRVGVWSRRSVAETRMGKAVLARLHAAMAELIPARRKARRQL